MTNISENSNIWSHSAIQMGVIRLCWQIKLSCSYNQIPLMAWNLRSLCNQYLFPEVWLMELERQKIQQWQSFHSRPTIDTLFLRNNQLCLVLLFCLAIQRNFFVYIFLFFGWFALKVLVGGCLSTKQPSLAKVQIQILSLLKCRVNFAMNRINLG